jgi:serine/tyrosine/threonine adenylyltransferase
MQLNITATFTNSLTADPLTTNEPRQVFNACYSYVTPIIPKQPQLIAVVNDVANELGISDDEVLSEEFLHVFSGCKIIANTQPYAMCYAGHQFGNWAGQLGDGRAINLTEIIYNNAHYTLQLKGAGPTPYSRNADGYAVLRSSIREYLCAEAMHYLGIPTTRSLSLMLSGNNVLRDVLYNGNAAYEKGAIVCRVAPSFIRFGNFELLAARQDIINLKALANYTIAQFYPHITSNTLEGYVSFFNEVAKHTLHTIMHWQRVGFVHGVMNTDNMSILGLTIDYGPYGWLEGYIPNWTPNTTDAQHSRYRFENQLNIGAWNLMQLANALYPLIQNATPLQEILNQYSTNAHNNYIAMMRSKLGLQLAIDTDEDLIQNIEHILQLTETDYTIFFRNLANIELAQHTSINAIKTVEDAFYTPQHLCGNILSAWDTWFNTYLNRLKQETITCQQRKQYMNTINPKYVLRNYMAQLAIDAANNEDYTLIQELQQLLKNPYSEQPYFQKWYAKRPEWARNKIGCAALSCSS